MFNINQIRTAIHIAIHMAMSVIFDIFIFCDEWLNEDSLCDMDLVSTGQETRDRIIASGVRVVRVMMGRGRAW